MPEMLQTLLAERFKLRVHVEKRDLPGYVLVVAQGSPKFSGAIDEQAEPMRAAFGDAPAQPLIGHDSAKPPSPTPTARKGVSTVN